MAASKLQTRFLQGSDFATDSCIRREGVDPQTGRRYLEEMTFEVVNEQPLTGKRGISTKAEDMAQRGVRRIFGVFVKKGVVKEWVGAWQALPADGVIQDPCLARGLPVRAILEATEADDAVVRALEAKGNRVIRQIEGRGRKKGRREGQQQALLTLLRARGFQVPDKVRDQILSCEDLELLERWIARAATAASLEPIFTG